MSAEAQTSRKTREQAQKNTRKTVLITGASEGIGYELTKLFARDGYNLVLVARNEAKLKQIADEQSRIHGISAKVIAKDLSKKAAPQEIYDELQKEDVLVDVLVNNAGYVISGPFAETDLSQELDMIQVLIVAPTILTKIFLKDMQRGNGGKILNLASAASFSPMPFGSIYAAAKSHIFSFSHAIAEELVGSSVTVTALCPGATRSQFFTRGKTGNVKLTKYGTMSAEKVALIGYNALMAGKRHVVTGIHYKMLIFMSRFMPWIIKAKFAKVLNT